MADVIGLYEAGTTGVLDGTLLSAADAETNAYAFASLNATCTLHYRTINGSTGDDAGKDTTAQFTVTAPANVQVYTGATWASSHTCATAVGANKPVYVRQNAHYTGTGTPEADLEVGTGGVTFIAGTRVGQVGTVTPTAGDASVVLAWSDIAMSTNGYYEVDRATSSDFATNLVHLTTTLADGSTGYTNNAANGNAPVNGTLYYYRVRAVDCRGVGAWSATASALAAYALHAGTTAVQATIGNVPPINGNAFSIDPDSGRIWTVYTGSADTAIFAEYSDDGGETWTVNTVLSSATPYSPILALDGSGVVHIVYQTATGTTDRDIAHITGSAGSWGSPTAITGTNRDYILGSMAFDSTGTLHLVFYADGTLDTYYSSWTTAGGWAAPATPFSGDGYTGGEIRPNLVVDDNDDIHVCYVGTTTNDVLCYRKSTDGGANWSARVTAYTFTGTGAKYPAIEADSLGNPHIVFTVANIVYVVNSTNSGTSFGAAVTVLDNGANTIAALGGFQLSRSDVLTVTMRRINATSATYNQQSYIQSSDYGVTWGSPVDITNSTTIHAYTAYPILAHHFSARLFGSGVAYPYYDTNSTLTWQFYVSANATAA